MFEVRKSIAASKMITVDTVEAPETYVLEAEQLAESTGKVHFVGSYYERNPECQDADKPGYNRNRIRQTGTYIISDDRDAIYAYKGAEGESLGGIIWCPPPKGSSKRQGDVTQPTPPASTRPAKKQLTRSREIRMHGVASPGECQSADATSANLAMLCGIGLEIAAQLAELNERLERLEVGGYPLAGVKRG